MTKTNTPTNHSRHGKQNSTEYIGAVSKDIRSVGFILQELKEYRLKGLAKQYKKTHIKGIFKQPLQQVQKHLEDYLELLESQQNIDNQPANHQNDTQQKRKKCFLEGSKSVKDKFNYQVRAIRLRAKRLGAIATVMKGGDLNTDQPGAGVAFGDLIEQMTHDLEEQCCSMEEIVEELEATLANRVHAVAYDLELALAGIEQYR